MDVDGNYLYIPIYYLDPGIMKVSTSDLSVVDVYWLYEYDFPNYPFKGYYLAELYVVDGYVYAIWQTGGYRQDSRIFKFSSDPLEYVGYLSFNAEWCAWVDLFVPNSDPHGNVLYSMDSDWWDAGGSYSSSIMVQRINLDDFSAPSNWHLYDVVTSIPSFPAVFTDTPMGIQSYGTYLYVPRYRPDGVYIAKIDIQPETPMIVEEIGPLPV